jgi:carbamoyltransferase
VLREKVTEYFELPKHVSSPYMLLVAPVKQDRREPGSTEKMKDLTGVDKLNIRRSTVPAVTHVDFSARVQSVDAADTGRYYRLLHRFYERTGCPVIINTSFNIRGEPIVCTPEDAYRCFLGTFIDVLVLENTLLLKEEQPNAKEFDAEAYKASFSLD